METDVNNWPFFGLSPLFLPPLACLSDNGHVVVVVVAGVTLLSYDSISVRLLTHNLLASTPLGTTY
jgi:hypothetical protein